MNRDDYSARKSKRDASYAREYAAWLASMTPEERRKADALGVGAPLIEHSSGGSPDRDAAESNRASCGPAEHEPDKPDTTGGMEAAHVLLASFLAYAMQEGNARLSLHCLAIALGLSAYDGESMTVVAARYGVTRQAVSKRCVDITKRLGIHPSRAMRSTKARATYRKSQLKRSTSQSHARRSCCQ